jgi:hypothetical protein
MIKMIAIGALSVAAASVMAPACAQVAGTYSGASMDGSGISYTVATDTSTGNLALTSASIGYTAPCKGSEGYTSVGGWGFGLNNDIVSHKVTETTYGGYFNFLVSLKFSTDGQSATGTIETIVPTLYPTDAKATKSLYCLSPKQTLTLSLQPPGAKVKPPLNTSYLYDRKGRIIGQTNR